MRMTTSPSEALATRLRVELARRRLSQADLARALGLSQAGVSRRLAGTTSWNVAELDAVARYLAVPFVELFDTATVTP